MVHRLEVDQVFGAGMTKVMVLENLNIKSQIFYLYCHLT